MLATSCHHYTGVNGGDELSCPVRAGHWPRVRVSDPNSDIRGGGGSTAWQWVWSGARTSGGTTDSQSPQIQLQSPRRQTSLPRTVIASPMILMYVLMITTHLLIYSKFMYTKPSFIGGDHNYYL